MAVVTDTLHDLAQHLLDQGRCVYPPIEDGSKRPDGKWGEFQERLSTKEELATWYSNGRTGIGLIGGAVSGNLEMFEFEGRAVREGVKDAYLDAARQLGLMPLLERISRGWSDRSPSGGIHLYYLVSAPVTETTELANRPASEEELAVKPEKQKLLIETRGEGGYMIIAPSCGRVHPDGPYERLHGGPDSIATITAEEREALLDLARSFDRMPKEEVGPQQRSQYEGDGLRPGDDFTRRADWPSILKPHGWEYLFTASDGNQYWRRPGRDRSRRGWSATINKHGEGVLYVHSTATEFEARRAYTKFAAYAILEHGGKWSDAARELRRQGYGEGTGEIRHGSAEQAPEPEDDPGPPSAPEQPRTKPAAREFPLQHLPAELLLLSEHNPTSMPAGFIAISGLIVMAGALGGGAYLRVGHGWNEWPVLHGGVVAPPGISKSPALWLVAHPLVELDGEARAHHRMEMAEWKERKAKAKEDKQPFEEPPPVAEDVIVSDFTFEALAGILEANPRGVTVIRDELSGLISGLNMYRKGVGEDRERLLRLHDVRPLKVSRVNEQGSHYAARPLVSILGATVPKGAAGFTGDDGLRGRWLLGYFPELRPQLLSPADSQADSAIRDWQSLIRALNYPCKEAREVGLTSGAVEVWDTYQRELLELWDQLGDGDQDLIGKYRGAQVLRIALVLWCGCHPVPPPDVRDLVDKETMRGAVEIARWFFDQALAHPVLGPSPAANPQERELDKGVAALADWLLRRDGKQATGGDVLRYNVANIAAAKDRDRLFARYQEMYPGHVLYPPRPEGGRPYPVVYAPGHAATSGER